MKILSVGDIHGEDFWEDIIEEKGEDVDKIVFVGDYFDSFYVSPAFIQHNFLKIVRLKKQNPDKIILLWGNHDAHYLNRLIPRGSGYNYAHANTINMMVNNNKKYIQLAYRVKNYLWTHAGVHIGWYKRSFIPEIKQFHPDWIKLPIDGKLNKSMISPLIGSIYDIGFWRGGNKEVGGPLWADKSLVKNKPLRGYHQIVGHTQSRKVDKYIINKDTSVTFIDTNDVNAFCLTEIE